MTNNGSGTLTWATASSGITVGTTTITSGTSTRVAFNDGGVYGEDADFTFDKTNNVLQIGTTITTRTNQLKIGGANAIQIFDDAYIENNIYIGATSNSTTGIHWGKISIGKNTTCGNFGIAIGNYSGNTGQGAYAGGASVAIGCSQYTSAKASGNYSIALGANQSTYNTTIGIGYLADPPADHTAVIGGYHVNGYITDVYFNGATSTAPYSVVINACGGSGTNVAGASFTIAGGKGTGGFGSGGNGVPGSIIFKTSTTLGSGTTLQTLVSRLTISGGAVTTDASTATWADALDFVFGTTTGTKFGTATTQKLAFWNATPIVQPTTAVGSATFISAGAGTNIKTDDTFDGYTLQQVVKALRNLGLLT